MGYMLQDKLEKKITYSYYYIVNSPVSQPI